MFDIHEIRFLTRIINRPYYLSNTSTLEYIMYHDIETYKIFVDFDIYQWILKIKKKHFIRYRTSKGGYEVHFKREKFKVLIFPLECKPSHLLERVVFNIDAVMIEIQTEHHGFSDYTYKQKTYYAKWLDPHHKRPSIMASYIEPIDVNVLLNQGHLFMDMIAFMAQHQFDLHPELLSMFKDRRDLIEYQSVDCNKLLFRILGYNNASTYLELLDDLQILEHVFPYIKAMKNGKEDYWKKGLKCLNSTELLLASEQSLKNSFLGILNRNFSKRFSCRKTKLVMFKFSILFYYAYHVFDRTNELSSFCSVYKLEVDTCEYYSNVVKYHMNQDLDLYSTVDLLSLEKQYQFFDTYKDQSIDLLLLKYVFSYCDSETCKVVKEHLIAYIQRYVSKYLEIQSINNEITTLSVECKHISDENMLDIIDDIKRQVFLGTLRYDRSLIIKKIKERI